LVLGADRAIVDAAGEPPEPRALGPVAPHQLGFTQPRKVADRAYSIAREAAFGNLANTENLRNRAGGKKGCGLGATEHSKSARLVEIGRNLGQEFVAGETNRYGDTDLALDPRGEA